MNKPVEVDGWKIYQYGYDTQMGPMSQTSILELVSDPWLPLVYTGIYMTGRGTLRRRGPPSPGSPISSMCITDRYPLTGRSSLCGYCSFPSYCYRCVGGASITCPPLKAPASMSIVCRRELTLLHYLPYRFILFSNLNSPSSWSNCSGILGSG